MDPNNEFFEFEQLYQKELDRIYGGMGYTVQRIKGKENEKFDVILTRDGVDEPVEEKGLRYYHPDAPIELLQDVKTCNLGWFYKTKARHIYFIYYNEIMPIVMYDLNLPHLKNFLTSCFEDEKVKFRTALKGFGITINMCIPWKYLVEKNIVQVLKNWKEQSP